MNTASLPAETIAIAASMETGKLGVRHLKRYWSKMLSHQAQKFKSDTISDEAQLDKTLLYNLGLGLEQTINYLYKTTPGFDEFEDWIISTAGIPSPVNIARFNRLFDTQKKPESDVVPNVLSAAELEFWAQSGYIIIRNAVPKQDCEDTIKVICDFIDVDRNNPATWYNLHPAKQTIMVQLFQHPVLQKNRSSVKIRQAFEQLWNRTDIWQTTDRVGFNPPETDTWHFPLPGLHWDVSLQLPIPFGLQGILYLADTAPDQGALTVVPGFQHRITDWLNNLPEGVNPREQDLNALGSLPIAANAGDMIIWLQALPHGASANTAKKPRFVQYISYAPAIIPEATTWK